MANTNTPDTLNALWGRYKSGQALSWPFAAKFPGVCVITGQRISVGEKVRAIDGKLVSWNGLDILSTVEAAHFDPAEPFKGLDTFGTEDGVWYVIGTRCRRVEVRGGKVDSQTIKQARAGMRNAVAVVRGRR
jgi:hypothetical protein